MPGTLPIIPVLDLMIGQIVLAVGGKRDDYQPVHSKLTRSSQPLDVAKAMFQQTGCDTMYLADIDSFAGAEPNWRVYNQLLEAGFGLWIDADWLTRSRATQISDKISLPAQLKIIISSETLSSLAQFESLAELLTAGIRPIFSLDKQGDTIITRSGDLNRASSLELIHHAYSQGVRELIILDLAGVGTMRGISVDNSLSLMIREIRDELTGITLTSGGGVRSFDDARQLLAAGCDHVLVASAIHECRFTPDDITNLQLD